MATAAQRQAAYRQRHLAEGNAERLNIVISVTAKRKLERLARHRGTTQRAVLEELLAEAEHTAIANLSITDERAYYDVTP